MAAMMKMREHLLHDYVAEVSERTEVRRGVPLPLGNQQSAGGVNFGFFSRHASRARPELFDYPDDAAAAKVMDLDRARNRRCEMMAAPCRNAYSRRKVFTEMRTAHRGTPGRRRSFRLTSVCRLRHTTDGGIWLSTPLTIAPQDMFTDGEQPRLDNLQMCHLGPQSSAIFMARRIMETQNDVLWRPLTDRSTF